MADTRVTGHSSDSRGSPRRIDRVDSRCMIWGSSLKASTSGTVRQFISAAQSLVSVRLRPRGQSQRSPEFLEELAVLHPELLRATTMRMVLRRFGSILRHSAGAASTFEMSKPVEVIAKFLSHSWSTPGWLKTIALMYHENVFRAMVSAFATAICLHGLEFVGAGVPMPLVGPSYLVGETTMHQLRLDTHFVPPCLVFILVLIFGQEVPGLAQSTCFLDKCCIHQTDQEKKMQGIQQLGGFLRSSHRMVILWQPEYFTRLWCVYELAAFHYINLGVSGLVDLLPLKLPVLALSLFCYHFAATAATVVLAPTLVVSEMHVTWVLENVPAALHVPWMFMILSMFFFAVYTIPGFLLWKFCQSHMEDRKMLLKQLRGFRMDLAECQVESDREFIESKLKTWFGGVEEFELVIRTEVAELVAQRMQYSGPVPWTLMFTGSLSHVFFLASAAVDAVIRSDGPLAVRLGLACIGLSCFTDAIALSAGLTLADKIPGRWQVGVRRFIAPMSLALLFSLLNGLVLATMNPALPLWIDIPIYLVLGILTWLMFGGWHRLRHGRTLRPSGRSEEHSPASTVAHPAPGVGDRQGLQSDVGATGTFKPDIQGEAPFGVHKKVESHESRVAVASHNEESDDEFGEVRSV